MFPLDPRRPLAVPALVRRQLALLGDDAGRDGLLSTPERVANAMAWLTRGYGLDARAVIGDALFKEVLSPKGVGVVIECAHLCMMMRGVEKQNSETITSALRGSFRSDAKTRDEFLSLAHAPAAFQ